MVSRTKNLNVALAVGLMACSGAGTSWLQAAPALPAVPDRIFTVTDFGGLGDGVATNTVAIQAAIQAAGAKGGGTVVIPAGVFLSGPLRLEDRIRLHLERGAILRMLPLEKYPGGTTNPDDFIGGNKLKDVAISGAGMIDGQGAAWWPYAKVKDAVRPRLIALSSCERVLIENVTLTNSPKFHIAVGGPSTDVTVRRVTVRANSSSDPVLPSHNTDACNVTARRALIQDCDISVGDDNFTCGGGTSDVLITNCTYGAGHGVSIGSYTRGGVSNFTVVNCTFNGTDHGIRIKSDRDRGGLLQNLQYLNLRMTNVEMPILVYGAYLATNREFRLLHKLTPEIAARYPAAPVTQLTPMYRNIVFSNITATAQAGRRAGLLWGLPESSITNVLLQQVRITADAPFGIYNARGVRFVDCEIKTPQGVNQLMVTNAQVSVAP